MNCVSVQQAERYCAWREARLPLEEEWQFAAEGATGRRYPWGDAPPDETRVVRLAAVGSSLDAVVTEPVGRRPRGATPEGVANLADNVAEYVVTYGRLPATRDRRRSLGVAGLGIYGGSSDYPEYDNDATRNDLGVEGRSMTDASIYVGFRCASDPAFNTPAHPRY